MAEQKNSLNYRFNDTLNDSKFSKLDQYWINNSMNFFYKNLRNGTSLPKTFMEQVDNQEKIIKLFGLRGFQFGNWLTAEDKFNYLTTMIHCLYDLNKVVRFNYNCGLYGELGVSFGARGAGSALAHFEPSTNIINITRYKRDGGDKRERFIFTGGVGSFAHEYGHFIDAYFGAHADKSKSSFSLTGWTSVNRADFPAKKGSMRETMNKIMELAYWKDREKKIPSFFIKRVQANTGSDYWICRAELWARIFEQYVTYKLQRAGIYNIFLSQRKYKSTVYMLPQELKAVEPHIDELLSKMRTYL